MAIQIRNSYMDRLAGIQPDSLIREDREMTPATLTIIKWHAESYGVSYIFGNEGYNYGRYTAWRVGPTDVPYYEREILSYPSPDGNKSPYLTI